MKTRVVRFHETGGPEVLRIESLEIGAPGPDEMRLRIEAIGLNRAEAAFRAGQYLEQPVLPARLGYEASGVVEAAGANVQGFAEGDAVCVLPAFSMNRYGVYAEHAIVPAFAVLPRPAGLSAVEAAAVWMQYLTAYGALIDIAQLGAGDAVVITAASSSVGLAAIQIANRVGAVPIAVTRTDQKKERLRAAGAAHVIASASEDLPGEVMRITEQRGARLVFDPVAGPFVATLAAALGYGGLLMLYGNLSGKAQETLFPFGLSAMKGISMRAYVVFEILQNPERLRRAREFVEQGLQSGVLRPVIDRTFVFEEIVAAHRYLESNQQLGKIVVTV